MSGHNVTVVTTDDVPGDERPVTGRTLVWAGGSTIDEAVENIQKWAAENKYDAIVGVRFTVAYVGPPVIVFPGRHFKHFAYGTCIRH
jgi:hypothetical protein